MKRTSQQMIDRFNDRLAEYRQETRVVEYSGKKMALSNGVVLSNNDKYRFCKRIMNTATDLWIENLDKILSGEISEEFIKSKLASIGGQAAQKKYGDTIKLNLNTGTPWNAGTKGQNLGSLGPRSQEVKDAISKKNSGSGNGMHGGKMTDAAKLEKSILMKGKILRGEFTPNSNNRNTHWDSYYKGKKYRSSWEALYHYYNNNAEYESLRVEYEFDGITHIYIVDFVDHESRTVVEVKPVELCNNLKFMAKKVALDQWALVNGYEVILATQTWLRENIIVTDYTDFDEKTATKIKVFYETSIKNRSKETRKSLQLTHRK